MEGDLVRQGMRILLVFPVGRRKEEGVCAFPSLLLAARGYYGCVEEEEKKGSR